MARRRMLGDETWARMLEPPIDERDIVRHYTLGADDHAAVRQKRGDANRLGFALVVLYLRHPGRVIEAGERPPIAVIAYVAQQLGIAPATFDDYARRDATRRAHVAEAMQAGGTVPFDRAAAHRAVAFLTAPAQTIVRPGQLAGILVDELRRMKVALPSAPVLEAVIRAARTRAERLGHEVLTAGLDDATLARLDALLAMRPAGKLSWLGWLRSAPQSPATGRQIREARAILGLYRSELAAKARSVTTRIVVEAEKEDGEPSITSTQAAAIERALVRAGIEFGPAGPFLRDRP